ncbi:MFS general substrate transporter [Mycena sanguinolenta]|uniref:MFS general substrate transporter n=1 Tax=Mycena sanguinolenta TaxID=230812 RepID=A0A8H6XXA7_9AGAR|nr:MFS general substrate transporter [Mycena sanguinolenta]
MEDKEAESAAAITTISDVHDLAPFEVPDGGFVAWCTVAGAWLVLFGTFGYAYTFGVYEDYYVRVFLTNHTPSSIAWIGSFQLMMPFLMGPIAGKIFDDGGFHAIEIVGGLIFTFSVFMLSLCKEDQYYQIFLAQGVGMGIGLGLTFLPSVSIVVHHFKRRRGLASGIVMSGSSIGATLFPIMTNHFLPRFGFSKTIRLTGIMVPVVLVIGNLMMRTRLPPRSKRVGNMAPVDIKAFFFDPAYMIAVLGTFLGLLGLYFPRAHFAFSPLSGSQQELAKRVRCAVLYIQLFSVQHNIDSTLAFYSVSILNASGAFVRVLGNHWADVYGAFNTQLGCAIGSGVFVLAILGIHDRVSLMLIALFYGAFSSAYLALTFACFSSLARGPEEVGARTGVALALCSLGTLLSGPIQGALLTSDFHWIRPVAFAAANNDTRLRGVFPYNADPTCTSYI